MIEINLNPEKRRINSEARNHEETIEAKVVRILRRFTRSLACRTSIEPEPLRRRFSLFRSQSIQNSSRLSMQQYLQIDLLINRRDRGARSIEILRKGSPVGGNLGRGRRSFENRRGSRDADDT